MPTSVCLDHLERRGRRVRWEQWDIASHVAMTYCKDNLSLYQVTLQHSQIFLWQRIIYQNTQTLWAFRIGQHNSPQVRLWDENVAHGEHAQPSQLLRGVKDHRWKAARHLGIQPNFDSSLDFVLALHQQIKQLLSIHNSFPEICHQANESCVPLVDNLGRKTRARFSACSPSICRKLSHTPFSHLTLVKVVEPEAMRICLTLL